MLVPADGNLESGVPTSKLRPSTVLAVHVVFTVLNAALFGNLVWLVPMLVRLHFVPDGQWRDWQTTLVTTAVPTLLIFSIFWGELLRRTALPRYVVYWWLATVFPLLWLALARNYWQLLALHVVACIGQAGWMPLYGRLLKHFYPDAIRGRAFGVLNAARLGGGLAAIYLVGTWLESDADAFRVYFPVAVGIQVVGTGVLLWLIRRTGAADAPRESTGRAWSALLEPVLHMGRTLRTDHTFRRYELAYMTYGAAFMVCDALLPVLGTDQFHMGYGDYAHSTQLTRTLVMLIMIIPLGWVLDRLGPVRTSGFAFGVLAIYPVGLLLARGAVGVGLASSIYGVGLAGVMMGWMLGPVSLAPSADTVPRYVAIHATLVGVRGLVFQGLGMSLYKATGSFALPLLLAAAAFVWAAGQMWQLQGHVRRSRFLAAMPIPEKEAPA
ncbi:MAG: hypothetical protein Kow0013_17080 [Pararhodobacter sp.]